MTISDKTLKLIADSIDIYDLDIDDLDANLSVVITAPILGQDDRRVQLEINIIQDFAEIYDDIVDALRNHDYGELALTGGEYTVKELEQIALLIKLAA